MRKHIIGLHDALKCAFQILFFVFGILNGQFTKAQTLGGLPNQNLNPGDTGASSLFGMFSNGETFWE